MPWLAGVRRAGCSSVALWTATDRPRRALYLTYNAASAGDFRDIYYADKRAEFATAGGTFGDERVRLSISDDFLGRPVPGR